MTARRMLLLFLPAVLLLALAGLAAWLLRTEAGAAWLWGRATSAAPGLHAAELRGDLHSGLRLRDVTYTGDSTSLHLDRATVRLAFDFIPPAVSVESLQAGRLEVHSGKAGDGPGSAPGAALARLALPVPVRFVEAGVTELVLTGADRDPPAEFRDLSFAGRWDRQIALRRLNVNYGGRLRVDGDARLGLQAPFALTAGVRAEPLPEPDSDRAPFPPFSVSLAGTLQALRLEASAADSDLRVAGTLRELLTGPSWNLDLRAGRLPLGGGSKPAVEARDVTVASSGSIADYRVELAGRLAIGDQDPAQVTLTGSGDRHAFVVESARLEHPAISLAATGSLDWTERLKVIADGTLERLDPSAWVAAWPAEHPVKGSLSFAWQDGRPGLPDFHLMVDGTPFEMRGKGAYDPAAGRFTADLNWQAFAWPIGSEHPAVRSREGALQLTGIKEAWTATGTLSLAAAEWPEGALQLSAAGAKDALHVEIPRGTVLGGTFEGTFDYRWSGVPEWSARIATQSWQTGALLPGYPGQVSGQLSLQGQPAAGRVDIAIEALDGEVRGRPVHADGRLSVVDGIPSADGLVLRAGASEVMLDGNPREPEGLAFQARVATLADFLDGADGRIEAEGRLAPAATPPRLDLSLDAEALQWRDWRIAAATARPMRETAGANGLRIAVEELSFGDRRIDRAALQWQGQEPLERIRAEARIGATRFDAALEGAVRDWRHPLDSGWHGQIRELRAVHETLGALRLRAPATFAVSTTAVQLDSACFTGPHGGSGCVDAQRPQQGDSSLAATFDEISLDLLRWTATTNVEFSQTLSGSLEWHQPRIGEPTAAVQLEISPGELVLPDDREFTLRTGPGRLQFDIREGRLQEGRFELPIVDAGSLDSDFSVADLARGAGAPVDARIRLELNDISPLARLFPSLDVAEGNISADLRISGSAADPVFTGYATLVRGHFEHAATGLVLRDIQLAGAVYEYDFTELHGTFRAGEGRGRIRATLGFSDWLKPDVTLEITGEELTLVNVPDLQMIADPDLRLHWRDGALDIDGRVVVPKARLSPRYLPTATVTESDDVVVVAGGDVEAEERQSEKWSPKLNGSVEITLGKDVSVTLERATAKFGGTVRFLWEDELMPIGDGTFSMTGEINAYGQVLQISEGRIRFPRRPANNPHLEIRAEREIFGNRQIKRAGVLITGTLNRPILETYTEPMTTRERALTLLVTGNDFDYEQGVGAVEVGMYVAPRLFVSYGIGLFDDQNVISARYDLKHGFGIKATSGEREAGADISYTIER